LVYLDTAPLPDGGSLIEKVRSELRERTEDRGSDEGWKFPVPPPEESADMVSLEGTKHRGVSVGSTGLSGLRNPRE
jgi:hypothetical protein